MNPHDDFDRHDIKPDPRVMSLSELQRRYRLNTSNALQLQDDLRLAAQSAAHRPQEQSELLPNTAIDDLDEAVMRLCDEYRDNPNDEDWRFKQGRARYVQARNALIESVSAALRAEVERFAPYLKEGETPIERLERERRDNDVLLTLLAKEKARAERAESALQWQPIETARDYINVLVYDPRLLGVCIGNLRDGVWTEPSSKTLLYPTHWMPLPVAPPSAPPRADQ